MEIKGQIVQIFDEQTISDNFKKREFVVRTQDSYPQDLLLQTVNNKTILLDKYNIGDSVEVGINLRGRAWANKEGVTKYFNTIEAWKISEQSPYAGQEPVPQEEGADDTLPF